MSNYQKTKRACYMGFITQAIAANFAPLLFLKFHNDYQIALGKIALISTCFFLTQLLVDLFCAKFVDKIGYRMFRSRIGWSGFFAGSFARTACWNYPECDSICSRKWSD